MVYITIVDTFLEGDTYAACQQNIFETVEKLLSLGFTLQVPTQKLCFIGFVINSVLMTVSFTVEKSTGIIDLCSKLLSYETTNIRHQISCKDDRVSSSNISISLT